MVMIKAILIHATPGAFHPGITPIAVKLALQDIPSGSVQNVIMADSPAAVRAALAKITRMRLPPSECRFIGPDPKLAPKGWHFFSTAAGPYDLREVSQVADQYESLLSEAFEQYSREGGTDGVAVVRLDRKPRSVYIGERLAVLKDLDVKLSGGEEEDGRPAWGSVPAADVEEPHGVLGGALVPSHGIPASRSVWVVVGRGPAPVILTRARFATLPVKGRA
jgi:hypothetical protein